MICCKEMVVTQQPENGILGGPINIIFAIDEDFSVNILQGGKREIRITSTGFVSEDSLFDMFVLINKFIMIFDGWFVPVTSIEVLNLTNTKEEVCEYSNLYMKNQLNCYLTRDAFQDRENSLLSYAGHVNEKSLKSWRSLLDELDIVHTVFLYQCANTGMTIDFACAVIIESFESLAELLESSGQGFSITHAVEGRTSLKDCLSSVIWAYGRDIFRLELSRNADSFFTALVNSRVRIMHIKRKYPRIYFNGEESLVYANKLQLLYRRVLLELLGIDYKIYQVKLQKTITGLDVWNGITANFLTRI